jgi:hypothetical protein
VPCSGWPSRCSCSSSCAEERRTARVFRHRPRAYARAMNAAPRPAARVLLSSRYLVPRVSLLALPEGPVVGLDLTRGVPVTLELVPARDGRARSVTATDLTIERPAAVVPDPPPAARMPHALGAMGRELGSRRARLTLLVGIAVAAVVVSSSLLGGSPGHARAVASARAVPPPLARAPAATPVVRRARSHVPPGPTSRGGPARVLVVAAPVLPVTAPPAARTSRREPAPAPSPGWVDGLVVGS